MPFRLKVLLPIISLFFSVQFHASHIMGGDFGYEFISDNGDGTVTYRVSTILYRDVDVDASGNCVTSTTSDFTNFRLGVYENISPYNRIQHHTGWVYDSTKTVSYTLGSDITCGVGSDVCVDKAWYSMNITIDTSSTGYHLAISNCCRNDGVTNFDFSDGWPDFDGNMWYAFIPNTNLQNNSPQFVDSPDNLASPLICVNDTFQILNTSFDPDGDSLAYHFTYPYKNFGPSWGTTVPTDLDFPLDTFLFDTGYSLDEPFGSTGYAEIDSTNGVTTYMIPTTGRYVVVVEVIEYRDGVEIGRIRRDMQLLAIACPANDPPDPVTGGSTSFLDTYTLIEGDTLDFGISIYDTDSIFVNSSVISPVSGVPAPGPTLPSGAGIDTLDVNFYWETSCIHDESSPYQFLINMVDKGCPSKNTPSVITVNVLPSTSASAISGNSNICVGDTMLYVANGSTTSTYSWIIENGTILGTSDDDSVTVAWNNAAVPYGITVVEISNRGCSGDTISKPLNNIPLPLVDAGTDASVCSDDSIQIGTAAIAGLTYLWSPSSGLTDTAVAQPYVGMTNTSGVNQNFDYYLTTTNTNGCVNSDTITVTILPAVTSAFNAGEDSTICPSDTISLGNVALPDMSYVWRPSENLNDSTLVNPSFNYENNSGIGQSFEYYLTATDDITGCVAEDSVVITVRPKPIIDVASGSTICHGETTLIGTTPLAGYTYSWTPTDNLSNPLLPETNFTGNNIGTVNDTLTYYLNVVGTSSCINIDSVEMVIHPQPDSVQLSGNFNPCAPSNENYLVDNFDAASTYSWSFYGSSLVSDNSDDIDVNFLIDTTAGIIVQETDQYSCLGPMDTITVNAHRPDVDSIFGAGSVCPNVNGYTYWAESHTGSLYDWTVSGGSIASGAGTDTLTVNWGSTGTAEITLRETDQWTCIGDRDTLLVEITPTVSTINPIGDTDPCENEDSLTYVVFPSPGATFYWSISGGTIIEDDSSQVVLVTWGAAGPGSISVQEISSLLCKGDTVTTSVTIRPNPNVQPINGTDSICNLQTELYTNAGTSISTYEWTVNNGNIVSGLGTDSVEIEWNIVGNDTILVTETTIYGCGSDTALFPVNIKPLPTVDAGDPVVVMCSGDTVSIGATPEPDYTYLWSPSTGLSDSTASNPQLTLYNTGMGATPQNITYYVTATSDTTGCSETDSITIIVNPQPFLEA